MTSSWTLEELTEFDLQLRGAVAVEEGVPDPRPRPDEPRESVLLEWLRRVRKRHSEAAKHARLAVRSEAWLRLALILFSLVAGMGAAAALLRYEGERLINISAYLGILVGGQLGLILLLAVGSLLFRKRMRGLHQLLLPRIVRESGAAHALPAWRWRIFTSFQEAGVGFNVGVILGTLWKVLTYDLAFGWATTLQVKAGSMHRLVSWLAAPWGGAYAPTAEQVRESRILLKQGLAQVDTASAAAWWPFLMMCVLCYGLLPRLLLTIFGRCRYHRILRNPPLRHPASERLYNRLTRPPLGFSRDEDRREDAGPRPGYELQALAPSGPLVLRTGPDGLDDGRRERLEKRLFETTGVSLAPAEEENAGVLQLVEAWRPPLEESLRDLQQLRQSLGPDKDLLVLCVGLPDSGNGHLYQAPEEEDLRIWRERLAELRDPRLGLLVWREDTP